MSTVGELVAQIRGGPTGPRVGAFFDFDGTLIDGYSAGVYWRDRLRRRELSFDELVRSLAAGIEMELFGTDVTRLAGVAAGALAGRSEDELEETAQRLFVQALARMIYPEARELVRAHQRMGHTVVIATSATRYQAAHVADDFGIDHILATPLEVENGLFTGRLGGSVLWGANKARAVREFARDKRIALSRSHAYANGDEDVDFLNTVGHAHAINPGAQLAVEAETRGWTVTRLPHRTGRDLVAVARTAAAIGALGLGLTAGIAVRLLNGEERQAGEVASAVGAELALALAGVRVSVIGEEHAWSQRPAVFIFNHQSSLDMLVIGHVLRRDVGGVAKKELRFDPMFGPISLVLPIAYVDRSNSARAREALAPVVEKLRGGVSFAIAPEGTRSPTRRLGPFKKGAFHIAMQAGVPIVPIVIRNAGDLMWRDSLVAQAGTVDVRVLPPMPTTSWSAAELDDRIAEIRRRFGEVLEEWPGPPDDELEPAPQATSGPSSAAPDGQRRRRRSPARA